GGGRRIAQPAGVELRASCDSDIGARGNRRADAQRQPAFADCRATGVTVSGVVENQGAGADLGQAAGSGDGTIDGVRVTATRNNVAASVYELQRMREARAV